MDFFKFSSARYSVRSFVQEHLDKETVNKILKAGHIAPTGCNNQPQRILVINTDESCEKLKRCTRCHFNAPCAMLVCYNKDECWTRKYDGEQSGAIDASIVTTHMMLQAWDEGIGTCWVMHFDPFKMREEFNIPENVVPVALLVMGKPAPDAAPIPMHSQYRNIEETVMYDSF